MLTINELLYNRGLPKDAKIKFVRHADNRFPMYDNYKFDIEKFLLYQRGQSKRVFHKCDYIISFLGDEGKRSRFIGVYKVNGFKVETNNSFLYDLTELEGFEDLKERVIIDWVSIPRSWRTTFQAKAWKQSIWA